MSEMTRRDVLQRLAVAFAAAGTIDRLVAQEAHHLVPQAARGGRRHVSAEGADRPRVPHAASG